MAQIRIQHAKGFDQVHNPAVTSILAHRANLVQAAEEAAARAEQLRAQVEERADYSNRMRDQAAALDQSLAALGVTILSEA